MSRRTVPILLTLLAAGGGAVLWIAGGGLAPPNEISRTSDESRAEANVADAATILDPSPVPSSPDPARETPATTSVAPTAREPMPIPIPRELEKAWWVEGRVILPVGTPADEEVHVLALGHAFASSRPRRAPIRSDGSFRVPFPAGTSHGALQIEARYLYLPAEVWIAPYVDKTGTELRPSLGGCVRGRVQLSADTDELRSELVGSWVNVVPAGEPLFPVVRGRLPTGTIDARLEFEVRGIPPGDHRVDVPVPVMAFVQVGTEVRVSPGLVHEVAVEFTRSASVWGIVVDSSRNAVASASVTLESDGMPNRHTVADEEGRFWFEGLTPGELALRASSLPSIPGPLTTVVLRPGQSVRDVEVVVLRGASISGRVVGTGGNGRNGVVHLRREDGALRSPTGGNRSELTCQTELGWFEFQGLEPGRYAAWVTDGKLRYSRSGIVVDEGTSIDDIELRLPAAGRVTGRVVDSEGRAVDHAFVLARGADWDLDGWIPGTDSEGRFVIDDLPLGDVWISAVKQSLVAPTELEATVRDDGSDEVLITLVPGTRLRLRLDKNAEENDTMTVVARDSQGRSRRVRRSWTGSVEPSIADPTYGPLPPGHYDIEATTEMGRSWRGSTDLRGEEIVTVTMVLDS